MDFRCSYWITSSVEFDPDHLVERLEIGLLFSRLVLESKVLLLGNRGGNVRGLEDLDTVFGDSMGSLRWIRCMFPLFELPQLHVDRKANRGYREYRHCLRLFVRSS